MKENDKEDFAFIKEKIKKKPVNKRRVLKQVFYVAVLAVLFGLIACFVFTYMQPYMDSWLHKNSGQPISISGNENTEETEELGETEEDTQEVKTEATVPETEAMVPEPPRELETSDYQKLQNKMYALGREVNHSIVTVTGVKSDTDWYNNAYESKGQASGIIFDNTGEEFLILTEHKVIKDASNISVTFINNVSVGAQLKKYDGNTGLAVLSVRTAEVDADTKGSVLPAKLNSSAAVAQGNVVIAVGSPLGTNYSILTGSITSVNNVINTIDTNYSVFTTDIIGSSNSSGALLNLKGEIVGLVMQDFSSQADENTLTALSISDLKQVIEMLSNDRDIPYLGLKICTVTDEIEKTYEIPKGVFIKETVVDSPAMEAGLQPGDVIVEMNGDMISTVEAYKARVYAMKPEETIRVTVKRQGGNDYIRITCQVKAGKLE